MEKFYFSPSNFSFYIDSTLHLYEKAGSLPADLKEISSDIAKEFMTGSNSIRCIGADKDGLPVWQDAPPLSEKEKSEQDLLMKFQLINSANEYMNARQWPGKASIGRLQGSELALYNLWLDYLDAVEAVDLPSREKVNWPTPPASN